MIYVTGDTHGDFSRLSVGKLRFLGKNDTLIICGDFGFIWDGGEKEKHILSELCARSCNICFIDGTHENFDLLAKYTPEIWNGGKTLLIGGNVRYLMRGQIFIIENKTIFTMGGGESPDREYRTAAGTYSPQEFPSQEEMMEGVSVLRDNGMQADYIITHEPPAKTKIFLSDGEGGDAGVTVLNTYFDKIAENCAFSKWYFGSMHADLEVSGSQFAVFEKIREIGSGKAV